MYVVLLLLSVLYRFALSSGFSGEPIMLKPSTRITPKSITRSETHHLKLNGESSHVKPGRGFKRWMWWLGEGNMSYSWYDPRCWSRDLLGSSRMLVGCRHGAAP